MAKNEIYKRVLTHGDEMSILVKDAWIVTQNSKREIKRGNVYIEENTIAEIGNVNVEAEHVIDGKDKILMPGLINTHAHVAMTNLRGMIDDVPLETFLERTFELDRQRDADALREGATLGIMEMLRTGTTTFVDFYYGEDIIASVAKEYGIRAYLGWAVLDEDKSTQKGNPVKNAESFIREFSSQPMIKPMVAPQGVYVCSEDTLLAARELAEKYDTLLTMHISETRKEVYEHRKKTGRRPVEYLADIEFLNPRLIGVHLVWLTLHEIRLLASHDVKVSHNPTSNMKLGNGGSMPLIEMLQHGILVTLGTDSAVTNNNLDMLELMKFASLLHKNERWDASVTHAQDILDFATVNAARALHLNAGSIEEGKIADLVLLDPWPNGLPLFKDNIISNIVYALNGLNVTHTIVNGKIVWKRS